jgi:hypothetical protein
MSDWNFLTGLYADSTLYMLLVTILMTLLLSTLLAFTYDKTTPPTGRSYGFIQALFLMSIVTATIMQSIGDNLAFSFGVFGALAIIRFRSMFSNLRDIAFIFATMAVGIACGVHSFLNGAIGTLTFCGVVFLLRLSPFDYRYNLKGHVRIETTGDPLLLRKIELALKPYCRHISVSRYRMTAATRPPTPRTPSSGIKETPLPTVSENLEDEFEFSFLIRNLESGHRLQRDLKAIEGTRLTRVMFENKDTSSTT